MAESVEWVYTIQQKDTLESISRRHLRTVRDWPRVKALNHIANPRHLQPGTTLHLPLAWMKTETTVARVGAVNGDVTVDGPAGGASARVRPGMVLAVGDTVRTVANSNVTIEFPDGSQMLVLGDSVLYLDTLFRYGPAAVFDTHIRLEHGRSENTAPKTRDPATRFEISTRAGVTSVRGTQWRVAAAADTARTETVRGEVALANAGGTVAVPAGFGAVTRAGEAPAPPTPLPPAPAMDTVPETLAVIPLRLPFGIIADAVAYRVQVAADTNFRSALLDLVVDSPPATLGDLANGSYAVRIRAIAANGLEGIDAERTIVVAAVPAAPALLEPEPDAIVSTGRPTFRWQPADARFRHRFQLATDAAFANVVAEQDGVDDSTRDLERDLPPAQYHWRVAAADAGWGDGRFSEARRFRIAPGPVDLLPPLVTPDAILARWPMAGEGGAVRVQLARDAAFGVLEADLQSERPPLRFARPGPGRYFVRANRIGTDGYEGGFGPPVALDLHAPPAAPVPVAPLDAAQADTGSIAFRWQPEATATRYRFQLAADARFDLPLADRADLATTTLDAEVPPMPGLYFWRVAAGNEIDGDGGFSPPRSIRRATPVPEPEDPILAPGTFTLRWRERGPGSVYRVELARDRAFTDPVLDTTSRGAATTIPRPSSGRYFFRVRPIEPDGAMLAAHGERTIDVPGAPAPPALLAPGDGVVTEDTAPRFTWKPGAATERYRIELATTPTFATPLLIADDLTSARHAFPDRLGPARYWWRVHAIDARDGSSGPGVARNFRVAPPRPWLRPPILIGNALALRWTPVLPGLWFEIELARDRAFTFSRAGKRLNADRIDLPVPHPGRYFARVRAIGPDGYAGDFSDVRTVSVPIHPPR